MVEYRATEVEHIDLKVGEVCRLESLRQAVVPPYVMIIPFIELPVEIEFVKQEGLEEDGIHGSIFTLRALKPGGGVLRVGFRDLQKGNVVIEKSISFKVRQ